MKFTLLEMQNLAASDPALTLVSCTKTKIGTDPITNADIFKITFNTKPNNYKLFCDVLEVSSTEIWALLEDQDLI